MRKHTRARDSRNSMQIFGAFPRDSKITGMASTLLCRQWSADMAHLDSVRAVDNLTEKIETAGIERNGSDEIPGGAETILLVEDEAFVRTVTAEVLRSAGYRIVAAANATQALEAYRDEPMQVDLLLTDVVMPGMSGRELAAEFKAVCPLGRVLLMSGYADEIALCDLSSQSKNYLGKPFSVGALLLRVREVLDTQQLP